MTIVKKFSIPVSTRQSADQELSISIPEDGLEIALVKIGSVGPGRADAVIEVDLDDLEQLVQMVGTYIRNR